jgi:hypothetical protein
MIVVFARPGRDALTQRTVELLEGPGGGAAVRLKVLWWVGETAPPPLPASWWPEWSRRPPGGPIADFWELLRTAWYFHEDLTVFEDDVIPCRNLIPYVERRPARHFTTYFNPWGRAVGVPELLTDTRGFDCSQAVTIPARLVGQLAALPDPTGGTRKNNKDGHDLALHDWLQRWGERVFWHRSLVQHEKGPSANGMPRPRWLQDPNFVGTDFDALALPDELPPSRPVVPLSLAGLVQR